MREAVGKRDWKNKQILGSIQESSKSTPNFNQNRTEKEAKPASKLDQISKIEAKHPKKDEKVHIRDTDFLGVT